MVSLAAFRCINPIEANTYVSNVEGVSIDDARAAYHWFSYCWNKGQAKCNKGYDTCEHVFAATNQNFISHGRS